MWRGRVPQRCGHGGGSSYAGEPWTSALQALDEHHLTAVPDALVHGDCWQGNSLWVGDELRGFIDWDAAGTGSPGIDLGTMRPIELSGRESVQLSARIPPR